MIGEKNQANHITLCKVILYYLPGVQVSLWGDSYRACGDF